MEPRMLTCVAQTRAVEEVVVAAQDDPLGTAPLELSHRICPTAGAVVDFGGELDIASAEVAVSYVRDVIDRHHGPVTVNLTALAFCDQLLPAQPNHGKRRRYPCHLSPWPARSRSTAGG